MFHYRFCCSMAE